MTKINENMKKTIYLASCLTFLSLFTACKKEDVKPNPTPTTGTTTNGGGGSGPVINYTPEQNKANLLNSSRRGCSVQSSLAQGAVAAAEAQKFETVARGRAAALQARLPSGPPAHAALTRWLKRGKAAPPLAGSPPSLRLPSTSALTLAVRLGQTGMREAARGGAGRGQGHRRGGHHAS